ncbi:MAG: hypothetical protein OEZ06_18085 [Myxococcales bacterium]|nr:hypothetical protein [Myxococcales bacterium]
MDPTLLPDHEQGRASFMTPIESAERGADTGSDEAPRVSGRQATAIDDHRQLRKPQHDCLEIAVESDFAVRKPTQIVQQFPSSIGPERMVRVVPSIVEHSPVDRAQVRVLLAAMPSEAFAYIKGWIAEPIAAEKAQELQRRV